MLLFCHHHATAQELTVHLAIGTSEGDGFAITGSVLPGEGME